MEIFALFEPVDVGANDTVNVLVPFGAIVHGNPVFPLRLNSAWSVPPLVMSVISKPELPVFLIVKV